MTTLVGIQSDSIQASRNQPAHARENLPEGARTSVQTGKSTDDSSTMGVRKRRIVGAMATLRHQSERRLLNWRLVVWFKSVQIDAQSRVAFIVHGKRFQRAQPIRLRP